MATSSSTLIPNGGFEDAKIWADLKSTIATSSGFQRWQREQGETLTEVQSLDVLVRRYLRETLETLAY